MIRQTASSMAIIAMVLALALLLPGRAPAAGSMFPPGKGRQQLSTIDAGHLSFLPAATHPEDLLYGTFLGGLMLDWGHDIAVDAKGHIVITGESAAAGFPVSPGIAPASTGRHMDAFVTKLDPTSGTILYSVLLGGTGHDYGYGVAVGPDDTIYVTGYTQSADFPTTAGAFDREYNGEGDAFLVRLDPTGSILYSTYLGGEAADSGWTLALDGEGNILITGGTLSSNFPVTGSAHDTIHSGDYDIFIMKLSAEGEGLSYSTFLGGSGYDYGQALAVDTQGNAYVAGSTQSTDFPTTAGAYQTTYSSPEAPDAFVAKLDSDGKVLLFSTFLGSPGYDYAYGIATDRSGTAYITGATTSSQFPTTPGSYDTIHNGGQDGFVSHLSSAGDRLHYSTFLGGGGDDEATALALDHAGILHVTGTTRSANFPTTPEAFNTSYSGGNTDAFVVRLVPAGARLLYGTFLGGPGGEGASSVALDTSGNGWITGWTDSYGFPVTASALQPQFSGTTDAFVAGLANRGATILYLPINFR
jgi:hypothetical protein